MMEQVGYRLDALSLVITPKHDLFTEFGNRGYVVRYPDKNDLLRTAKGYNKANALMITIGGSTFTMQTREEWLVDENEEKYRIPDSGFIALSGTELDGIDIRKFLIDTNEISKATRVDIASDIIYATNEQLCDKQNMLAKFVGFQPDYFEGNKQNPNNSITAGIRNPKKPIKVASKTASNGMTLYIGGRQSKFMIRCYDKSAEVFSRTNKEIFPTLRIELELKQEIAEGVRKYIMSSKSNDELLYKMLWHNISNDYVTINDNPLGDVFDLGKAKTINIDYTKVEGRTMEYDYWVRSAVSPKFGKLYKDLTRDERVEKALSLLLSDEDFREWQRNETRKGDKELA